MISLFVAIAASSAIASDYDTARTAAVARCSAIDPAASQSGLFFNPDGYRSYYVRSQCFQEAAVNFRDGALCAQVKQRRSVLSSSWGYSAARCRALVAEGLEADRQALEDLKRRYRNGAVTLRDFRIEPNGNGRDFDVIPAFSGENGGGYTLTLAVVPSNGDAIILHSSGYHVDGHSNLRIFVTGDDIRRLVPGFVPGRRYRVRVMLTLTTPSGTGDVRWSDAFVERVFPARDRSQSMTKDLDFPAAPAAGKEPLLSPSSHPAPAS